MTDIQYLTTPGTLELRGGSRGIGGLALTFGQRSKPIGGRNGFIEVVAPSFISAARASHYRGIICRYSHRDEYLLGAVDAGTLALADNDRGLDYTCQVPEYHDFVYQSVKRGDCRASSFSFVLDDGDDVWEHVCGMMQRTLNAGTLLEVSPCPVGQYPNATVGLRSGLQSLARHAGAPVEDVEKYYENGELAKFVTRSDRPAAPPARTSRSELVENLSQDFPEVRHVGKSGKQALAETMYASPEAGAARSRQRLLDTMAEHPAAVASRITPWEARLQLTLAATPPVYATTEVSVAEYQAIAEVESSRKRLAEAETRWEVRRLAEVRSAEPEPQRRTMTGHEALRILDGLRPSLPYQTAASQGLDECY
jgi:HK97 family phage prohead protease